MGRFHMLSTQNLSQRISEMCQGLMAPTGRHQSIPQLEPHVSPLGPQPLSQWCHRPAQLAMGLFEPGPTAGPRPSLASAHSQGDTDVQGWSCPGALQRLCSMLGQWDRLGSSLPPLHGEPLLLYPDKIHPWDGSEKLWGGPEQQTRKNKWKTFYKAHLGYFKHSSLPRHPGCDGKQLRSKEQKMPQEQHVFCRVTGLSSGHVSSKKRKKAETKTA